MNYKRTIFVDRAIPNKSNVYFRVLVWFPFHSYVLFFLFYSTKSYIQMEAILDVIRALRSSQPPTIVRVDKHVFRFSFYRDATRSRL